MTTQHVAMAPEMSAALVKAQELSKAVGKDGTNKFHNYKYASAEAMIEEARSALTAAGLALAQVGVRFVEAQTPRAEKLPIGRVHITYRLIHTSGQVYEFESSTAVIPEKGRPDDKAEFGAITANLGYTLRGLLLLPREDESASPETRDDRAYTPKPLSPPPALPVIAAPAAPASPPPAAAAPGLNPGSFDSTELVVDIQRRINSAKSLEETTALYPVVKAADVTKPIKDALFAHLFGQAFKLAASRADLEAWAPAVKASGLDGEAQAWTRSAWEHRFSELPS
jgi:hypothetical protein